ncbi:MAG: hypothetical protein HY526_08625 [Betaproteobacteria bacterium]|nr:hypothetical protein [Betaproteobacteria bacterium]
MADKKMWMVRAGESGCAIQNFRSKSIGVARWAQMKFAVSLADGIRMTRAFT